MSTFSFARNSMRDRTRRGLTTCAVLAVASALVVPPSASAQHAADQPAPRAGAPAKGALSPKPAAKPVSAPRVAGAKRAALQNFEQKVQPDGSIIGVPVELEMGISETMSEIMDRQAAADKLGPPEFKGASGKPPKINELRSRNPQNPDSINTPSWPMIDTGPANEKTHTILAPQTIGTNFTSATVLGVNPTGSLPPDTMGAVGPTQFITAVNGRIVSFNKATGAADGVINTTEDTFFTSVRNGAGTSDPRIRYDRLTGRWFVIIINVSTPNRVLLAVSNTSTITGATVWTFFFIPIDTTPPAISATCLFDYPTLGIDDDALYIGGNNFCGSPTQTFNSCDGFVVRKSSILGAGPIVVTAFRGLVPTASGAGPYTPQGVDNFDPASNEGYFIGVDNATFGTLMLRRVSTPGGTPTISANVSITVPSTAFPITVRHLGNTTTAGRLDALDDRLFAAHIRNGRLWTAHNIGVDNTGVTGTTSRDGCRWYELQGIVSPGTPSVVQSGTVFAATAANDVDQLNYWIPSIMVSGQGHAAIGSSVAGTGVAINARTRGRLSIDTLGTMQAEAAITTSATDYTPSFDTGAGRGSRRWGDYSYTCVDPMDDMTMWTTQMFCDAVDSYGVRVTRLIAPPPPTPMPANDADGNPVAVYPYPAGKPSFQVSLTGTAAELAAGEGYYDPGTTGFAVTPNRLTAAVSGGVTVNSVTYVDRTSIVLDLSSVGATQGLQTITITNPDGQQSSAAILNILAPNAVGLEQFTATRPASGGDGTVSLAWTTGFEVDNLGFNVYRESANGRRQLVTPKMIAGSALVSSDADHAVASRSYSFTDHPPGNSRRVRYWLEDVDTHGHATMHGPFRLRRAGPGDSASGKAPRSLTIDELGAARHDAVNSPVPFVPEEPVAELPELEPIQTASTPAPPGNGDVAAVKMTIRREGWYVVTAADLAGAGINPSSLDPRNLQLFAEGRQVPILVTGEADGRFDATDRIEFYGLGMNLPSTDARVAWLVAGSQAGLRIRQVPAAGTPAASGSYQFTVESRERLVYFPSLANGDAENFYGQVVTAEPVEQSVLLRGVDRSPVKRATVDVGLQGVTDGAHRVSVALNGQPIGEVGFTGTALGRLRVSVPADALVEGANVVTMTAQGTGVDVSLVEAVRVTYFHQPLADDNVVRAPVTGLAQGTVVTYGGFSSPEVRVVDVTNPSQPVELLGTVAPYAGGNAVTVRTMPGARTLYAFASPAVRRPDAIVVNQPTAWRTFTGADLLIVAPRAFFPALQPLVAARQAEGLTVALVDVEDAFDEFSFGVRDPRGLQAFIGWTLDRWQVRPRYVLLAGDGSYDPRDYFGYGIVDRIPVKLFDSRFLETASDEWFADRNGDGVAEAAIGRLPAQTPEACAAMVQKILAYGSTPASGEVVFVSDTGDTFDFHAESARVLASIPSAIPRREIERGVLGDSAARTAVLGAFGAGPRLLSWNGHGSVGVWRGNLLTAADAGGMTNGGALPIVTTMTCLNNYFTEPSASSLGESLVLSPGGGAAAVWASTALTAPEEHTPLNAEFYRVVFANPGMRLGDAIRAARGVARESDTRRSWVLLGDPSMRVKVQ